MPQAEAVSIESVSTADRSSTGRKRKSEVRYGRRTLRDNSSIGYVVEWQLTPLDESEAAPAETPAVRLSDLSD